MRLPGALWWVMLPSSPYARIGLLSFDYPSTRMPSVFTNQSNLLHFNFYNSPHRLFPMLALMVTKKYVSF